MIAFSSRTTLSSAWKLLGLVTGVFLLATTTVLAQQLKTPGHRHFPMNARMSPGVASNWASQFRQITPGYLQPVQVTLPTKGTVTFFQSVLDPIPLPSPAQASIMVGTFYRIQIRDLPEFPGVTLYPSIELISHLHPPPGQKEKFPVPISITEDEIQSVVDGKMVTKVIYLEQPQRAIPFPIDRTNSVQTLPAHVNLLAEADLRGRPVAILKIGSRLPNAQRPDPRFFGRGGPVQISVPAETPAVNPALPAIPNQSSMRNKTSIRNVSFLSKPSDSESLLNALTSNQTSSNQTSSNFVVRGETPPPTRTETRSISQTGFGSASPFSPYGSSRTYSSSQECNPCYPETSHPHFEMYRIPHAPRIPLMNSQRFREYAKNYPDEYLCDGGDRAYPVHYDKHYRHGFDTEDTIAEYTDHEGHRKVKPSNRVCVYAPRFVAVRTITAPLAGYNVNNVVGTASHQVGAGFNNKLGTRMHIKNDVPVGARVRTRASGIESESGTAKLDQAAVVSSHTKLINIYQNLNFVKFGHYKQSEGAYLSSGVAAALAWSKANSPVILGVRENAVEVQSLFHDSVLIGIDERHKKKGDLRIVKLADKKVAKPGDLITFTIRYDNIGDHELKQIRILDNLTPRLEYIENSASSSREGRLDVVENAEGSLILKFILTKPLKGHTGGVVTFKTKVR